MPANETSPIVDLTFEEELGYIRDLVNYNKSVDPEYGKLPESVAEMASETKLSINALYRYFQHMRKWTRQSHIDSYSLYETIGFKRRDVKDLVGSGVLSYEGEFWHSGMGNLDYYLLTKPFYDFYLTSRLEQLESR